MEDTFVSVSIVSAWLTIIALTLLVDFNFVDVAVKYLAIVISIFAMISMAKIVG